MTTVGTANYESDVPVQPLKDSRFVERQVKMTLPARTGISDGFRFTVPPSIVTFDGLFITRQRANHFVLSRNCMDPGQRETCVLFCARKGTFKSSQSRMANFHLMLRSSTHANFQVGHPTINYDATDNMI